MFESVASSVTVAGLRVARERLGEHRGSSLDERELLDQIEAMEELKSGLSAAQARLTASLYAQRSAREAADGVVSADRCKGLGAEVALARRESPLRGGRLLGLARALVEEMPHTLAALTAGSLNEWRATLLVRETAVLTREHRGQVDAELAGTMTTMGDRRLAACARSIGYRLDAASVLRRTRGAVADRRVGLRPAPDTMTFLTAFLPVAQGVACHLALSSYADAARASGDERSRGQIMADTLVARVTGQETAGGTPIEINLVMTDAALLGEDDEPAQVRDYGPIPAFAARSLVREADRAWIRRLYADPVDRTLVGMDSRRRLFEGQLRELVVTRDQFCRNIWCDARVRHVDHIVRSADGGATSVDNGQGLCEACNYLKEVPGWRTSRPPGLGHQVQTTTPTGRTYLSRAPALVSSS